MKHVKVFGRLGGKRHPKKYYLTETSLQQIAIFAAMYQLNQSEAVEHLIRLGLKDDRLETYQVVENK